MANYTVTVRCNHCRTVYMMEKWNSMSVGQTTTPNAGMKCPGCQGTGTSATVVATQKVGA